MNVNYIFIVIFFSVVAMFGTLILSLLAYKTRKTRYEKEIFRLGQERELFSYYLKNEMPRESFERAINNSIKYKNTNFDYESKLIYEISRLRRDINRLNDKFIIMSEEKKNIERSGEEFNYNDLISQLSNMTNIDYLFNLLNKDQEEKIEYIKNVLADIVHTIRNPVSGIKALIQIIKIQELNDDLISKIRDIENYIEQIEDNLNAYYEVSHVTTVLADKDDTVDLTKEIQIRSRLLIISSGKVINLKITEINVILDRKIAEVLLLAITCILENAILFSPDNGDVIINIESELPQITIGIENGGPIIEKDVITKIFNQGFSTRGSTGRGLAIAKKAVEETLNGVVVCENIGENTGVKFTIIVEVKTNDE